MSLLGQRTPPTPPAPLARSWWMLGARGALALLFGLAALAWPGITLGEFVLLFGAYAFIDGLAAIASALRFAEGRRQGWPLLLEGAVSSAIGIAAWASPMVPITLLYLVATWGIITGVLEIAAAAGQGREPTSRWLLAMSGASSVLLGMVLMALPAAGAIAVVRLAGVYALIFGVLVVASAIRLRRHRAG